MEKSIDNDINYKKDTCFNTKILFILTNIILIIIAIEVFFVIKSTNDIKINNIQEYYTR